MKIIKKCSNCIILPNKTKIIFPDKQEIILDKQYIAMDKNNMKIWLDITK